jgi:hypothetical protein
MGDYLPVHFLFPTGFPELQLPGDNAARYQQQLALLKQLPPYEVGAMQIG